MKYDDVHSAHTHATQLCRTRFRRLKNCWHTLVKIEKTPSMAINHNEREENVQRTLALLPVFIQTISLKMHINSHKLW